ncbi:hypothetical protein [Streptomyces asiaticus]|uniref:hypothetical protein n=1 Tax=Streptomyces asiaticus TaxID=114695 RepID=UPI003F661351
MKHGMCLAGFTLDNLGRRRLAGDAAAALEQEDETGGQLCPLGQSQTEEFA